MYTKILIYDTYYSKKFEHNAFFLCYKYNRYFLGNFFYTIIQITFSKTQNTTKSSFVDYLCEPFTDPDSLLWRRDRVLLNRFPCQVSCCQKWWQQPSHRTLYLFFLKYTLQIT